MFVDNGNGTVSDTDTGLMWKQDHEEGTYPFDEACGLKSDCAGFDDWRLPTIDELNSLVDRSRVNPAIDVTAFPSTPYIWFWSSSPYAGSEFTAWRVSFYGGVVNNDGYRGCSYAVRLVRSIQ